MISPKQTVVLGASGQIGSAFVKRFSRPVLTIPWEDLKSASTHHVLENILGGGDCDFILAGGVTDPKLPREMIFDSNFFSVVKVVDTARGIKPASATYRFMTLGTIHESFNELSKTNPYLESKVALGMWVAEQSRKFGPHYAHLRLQTIYGAEPKSHMFLGQMLVALRNNELFKMSTGEQLREYHHSDEIAEAMQNLTDQDWDFGSILNICSGEAIRLAELASSVFKAFDRSELLQIGALPSRAEENRDRTFVRSPHWLVSHFRPSIPGITECLKENLRI